MTRDEPLRPKIDGPASAAPDLLPPQAQTLASSALPPPKGNLKLVNNANLRFPVRPFVYYRWEDFEHKLLSEMRARVNVVAPGLTHTDATAN